MATGTAAFPGRPYTLRIEVWYNWQSGRRASVHTEVWIDGCYGSYSGAGSSFEVYVDGVGRVQRWEGGFDFRGGCNFLIHRSDYEVNLPLNGNSGAQVYASYDVLGYAQTGATVDGADAVAPAAPTPIGLDEITTTSMRYRFSGNSDGGAPILEWQAQYDDDVNFGSPVTVSSSGVTTASSLPPGTKQYWRSRGRNAVGWGAWSSVINATTIPAVAPGLTVTTSPSGQFINIALTPPGGVSGVTSYLLEKRSVPDAVVLRSWEITSPNDADSVTPGGVYEYRAAAKIGTYTSPYTAWTQVTAANPNTNPGTFFDGATTDTPDVDYAFTGTAHLSTSTATGVAPLGWSVTGTGGASIVQRVRGGRSGSFAARVTVQTTQSDVRGGMQPLDPYFADVEPGAQYFGSVYVWGPTAVSLTPEIGWYTAAGVFISRTTGTAVAVPAGLNLQTRLVVSGAAPANADKAVVTVLAAGSRPGGTTWTMDDAMVTLAALFDWFSGDSADTTVFAHAWEGTPNASVSSRTTLEDTGVDLLADPDCPPLPQPPVAPTIYDPCIDEVGSWRRYWASIPATYVTKWLEIVPTFRLTTQAEAARQVRVRVYPNPLAQSPGDFDASSGWDSEQVISFIPPNTTVRIDGVSERVRASVGGGDWIPADQLLYGTGGAPADWPLLDCGIGYLIAFDAPLDASPANLGLDVDLTRRY